MSAEIKKEIQLEIAHVLFIDIVGYSKLSINDQHAASVQCNGEPGWARRPPWALDDASVFGLILLA
jgi:hypothetical protein